MNKTWLTGINITIVGLIIVFLCLSLIATFVRLMGWWDSRGLEREAAQEKAAFHKPQTIDETTLVLISAAVATLIQGRFHIRSVRRITTGESTTSPWSMQGRAVLHGSHVIHKKEH